MSMRIAALQERMADKGYGAFVSIDPPTNRYLTGFSGTTSGLMVTRDESLFLCDSRYTEQASVEVQDCVIEELSGNFVRGVGEALKKWGVAAAVFEPSRITVADKDAIEASFGGALQADDELVTVMRQVKSRDEIEKLRAASALAEEVLGGQLSGLQAGVTERETAARLVYEFQRGGASGPSFDPIALFGARSSLPHGQPGATDLRAGDIVLLDFGCVLDGYCSDLTRTYAYGSISGAWFEELYELVFTAQSQAIEAVRPGIRCRDLDDVARRIIEEAGYGDHFGHGLGHGVGLEIHEGPRVNKQSDTLLEPGMVITIEPGVYLPGRGGVRIEDLVAVTADGADVLSTTPKELRILER